MTICDNCIHRNVCADEGHYDEALSFCADKIEERPTGECNCSHCDYFKFSQSFIKNVVKFMTDYNIESVEDLMKELNHINELLGGGKND